MKRSVKVGLTLLVTALCTAYVIWKIDLGRTLDLIRQIELAYFLGAVAIMIVTTWPMALRWKWLLDAERIHDRLGWLTRAYFVSYAAGQVLPTAIGGDASRVYETARRHPGTTGRIAGSVVLERAIGGAATLLLAAVGLALAVGEYDIGIYLWIEAIFVVGTIVGAVLIFSKRVRGRLAWLGPPLARIRLERPLRALYEGVHVFRRHVRLMAWISLLTLAVQAVRVLAIWMAGRSVGVDLSPRPYYVMGPLLFLVILVPFTINGLAVREAFFVSFLTKLGVDKESALATGFLFFVVTIALALPGAVILGVENLRGLGRPRPSKLR